MENISWVQSFVFGLIVGAVVFFPLGVLLGRSIKTKTIGQWNWQRDLLMIVVTFGWLALLISSIVKGNSQIPALVNIIFLSIIGGFYGKSVEKVIEMVINRGK